MATRRLEVDLVVDDSQARTAFARTGRSVSVLEQQFGRSGAAISKAAGAASTRISQIGSAARTAAPWVGGALALGLGKAVAEAREAEKAMGQTEAVIKSTGGAANVTANQVASLSQRISEKAAIDDEAIQSGANLLLTFKNIRNEVGAGNDIFNQSTSIITDMSVALDTDLKSAAIQVGKALNDPTVGLTALSRAGVTFTLQEKEKIQTLFESGEQLKAQKMILAELSTEFKGSAAAQADAGDRIAVVFNNLAEDIGLKILPGLEELGNEVSDVLSSKKLTGEEKAGAIGDILQERIEDGIDALSDMAPELAKAGGQIAGRLATGFAEAWWNSDAIGKLFLTGAFIRLIGGPGALGKLGSAIGGRIVTGMATTIAADLAAETAAANAMGGKSSKWGGLGRSIGRQIGPAMGAAGAVGFLAYFQDDIQKAIGAGQSDPIFSNLLNSEAFDALFGTGAGSTWNPQPLLTGLDKMETGFENFGDVAKDNTRAVARALRNLSDKADDTADKVGDAIGKGAGKIDSFGKKAPGDLDKVGDAASKNAGRRLPEAFKAAGKAIEDGGKATDKFADGASRNLDRVGDSSKKQGGRVADNAASMVNAVLDGLGILGKETKDALKAFGVNKTAYSVGNAIAKGADGVQFKQQGGVVVPGHGTGDSFPMMMPAGGFVLNRDATNAFFGLQRGGMVPTVLEPGELAFPQATPLLQLMNDLVPRRLQKGGSVIEQALGPYSIGPIQYDANHAGGNSHLHLDFYTQQQAITYGKKMQQMGWNIDEYSGPYGGFGGLSASHQSPGHYDGTAFDANTDADETQAEVAAVARLLGSGVSGAMVDKLKRIILKGPKGPLLKGGQGALDMGWKAANALIRRESASSVGGGVNAKAYTGPLDRNFGAGDGTQISFNQAAMLAEKAGLPGITYAQIAIGESNLTPGAVSPDGGYGLWQMTPRVQSASTVAAWEKVGTYFNPWNNAQQAKILAGGGTGVGNYYGTGSVTDWNKHYTGPMKFRRGGVVGRAGIGGKKPPHLTFEGKNPGPGFDITGTFAKPPGFIPNPPPVRLPAAPPITVENQLTALDIALTAAEQTDTIADDAFVLGGRESILAAERDRVAGELSNLSLSAAQRKAIQKQAQARADALRKKLKKGGLTDKERKRIEQERIATEQSLAAKALGEKRTDLLGQLSSLTSELEGTRDSIEGLTEVTDEETEAQRLAREAAEALAAAQAAAAEEMKALRESIDAQNRIITSEVYVQRQELLRGIADLISGEIGGRIAANEYVPGYGAVATA